MPKITILTHQDAKMITRARTQMQLRHLAPTQDNQKSNDKPISGQSQREDEHKYNLEQQYKSDLRGLFGFGWLGGWFGVWLCIFCHGRVCLCVVGVVWCRVCVRCVVCGVWCFVWCVWCFVWCVCVTCGLFLM